MAQIVGGVVGRREQLDAEALVQRSRPAIRLCQPPGQLVEELVGVGR